MKRVLPLLAAVGALAIALPAGAQAWLPINARQQILDARIDQGVRSGALTSGEALRLRGEYRDIAAMEARYRATGGLQDWERRDLDRRFDHLNAQIRIERTDAQYRGPAPGPNAGGWVSINARQAALDARIDQGVRSGALTANEAVRLRTEFRDIANLEARYRQTGGLQGWEQADLDRRLDQLNTRVRVERTDGQRADGGPGAPWQSINMRQAMLDRRIDQGLRDGSLSRGEATRLQREFQQIAALENRYRATGGLQGWERADLDQRFDRLSAQIRLERADRDNRSDRGVGANAGYYRR